MIGIGNSLRPLLDYDSKIFELDGPCKTEYNEDLGGTKLTSSGSEAIIQGSRKYNLDTFVHFEDFGIPLFLTDTAAAKYLPY